ncbi:MAG: ABC transporter permease [Syntrophomonas sp.]|jgi:ABC-2 type transport system permease protein|nr:ABC transporter permease [Syntrophomonas sp.]
MRVRALAMRILNQIRHDKRTLALMMLAPLLMLTLMYFIFEGTSSTTTVAVINAPVSFVDNLEANNVIVLRYSESEAQMALELGEVVATINVVSGKSYIELDGSDPGKAKMTLAAVQMANLKTGGARTDLLPKVHYVYGYEDSSMFDNYGAVFIGFIVFFFTFLVAGISFLQERTTGTLEKLLSMPIKRWEIVVGYVLGFGVVTVLQSFVISWFCIYVLDMSMTGSFALVLLITLLTAMVALTFGILASTAANSEFQMMQFIPVVIIPQLFFSGIFDLPAWLEIIERAMPLYYIANALTQVMIKGSGITVIAGDLVVILGFSLLFMVINTRLLKKYRRI